MGKHIENAKLYLFCIIMTPYVILRVIVSLIIKVDAWNDKVINQFKIDTKNQTK